MLTVNNQEITTHALNDCAAPGIAFLDQDFAQHYHITHQAFKIEKQVEVIDGRPVESREITHIAQIGTKI